MNSLEKGVRSLGLYFDKDSPLHVEIRESDPVIDNNSEVGRLWYNKTENKLKYTFLNTETNSLSITSIGDISSSELDSFINDLSNTGDNSPGSDFIGVEKLSSEDSSITIPAGTLSESLVGILNSVSNIEKSNFNCVSKLIYNNNKYSVIHNFNTMCIFVQVFAKRTDTEENYKLVAPDITIIDENTVEITIEDNVSNDSICNIVKTDSIIP